VSNGFRGFFYGTQKVGKIPLKGHATSQPLAAIDAQRLFSYRLRKGPFDACWLATTTTEAGYRQGYFFFLL
jgi:hypothetical protein